MAQKLGNIRLYRLAQALIWIAEDVGLKEIAKRMGVWVKTIVTWVQTFIYKGIAWLTDLHYQGRVRKDKLTCEQKQELTKRITAGPEVVGCASRTINRGR